MNCIFCNNPITGRSTGDHIVPQGLGKFYPEYTVFHICRDCDSKHGHRFERIALRTGMLAVFRSIKRIKSRNNKKSPLHSPSLDKFSTMESQDFAIVDTIRPHETVYVSGSGKVRFADTIKIRKNGELIDTIEIPPTRDVKEICNFIEAKLPVNLDEVECELNISEEQREDVLNELRGRGRKLGELYPTNQPAEFSILKISSIFTENHFRFVASTVLKGLIFLDYSADLLRPLIEYVKTGENNNVVFRDIDAQESGWDALDDPPLNKFYHAFEWGITDKYIAITASILAHKHVNGIRMKLVLKTGSDNSIFIPYGKIIARYGNTPKDGTLEIFHGDHKVEK